MSQLISQTLPARILRVALLDRHLAVPQALHLAADQGDPALQRLQDLVLVQGLAVLGDRPLGVVGLVGGRFLVFS